MRAIPASSLEILLMIYSGSEPTQETLASATGLTTRSVNRLIQEMERNGFITVVRNGRNNHYSINPNAVIFDGRFYRLTIGNMLGSTTLKRGKRHRNLSAN